MDLSTFPMVVNGKQWREAVVPVLEDDRFRTMIPLYATGLDLHRLDVLVSLIGKALRVSFTEAGYGISEPD